MKRIKLVLAVGALMVAMLALNAGSAMADVDFDDRLDERADRIEERLENHGYNVDVDDEDVLFWYGDIDYDYDLDYELEYEDGLVFWEVD